MEAGQRSLELFGSKICYKKRLSKKAVTRKGLLWPKATWRVCADICVHWSPGGGLQRVRPNWLWWVEVDGFGLRLEDWAFIGGRRGPKRALKTVVGQRSEMRQKGAKEILLGSLSVCAIWGSL